MLIPFSVGTAIAGNDTKLDINITSPSTTSSSSKPCRGRLTGLLRTAHKLKPGQRNDFKVQTAAQLGETLREHHQHR